MQHASVSGHNARRQLDRWAVECGYNSFDTFISVGGSILACRDDLIHRRENIDLMLQYLNAVSPPPPPVRPASGPAVGAEALARAEADVTGEDAEPRNAAIQGGEG